MEKKAIIDLYLLGSLTHFSTPWQQNEIGDRWPRLRLRWPSDASDAPLVRCASMPHLSHLRSVYKYLVGTTRFNLKINIKYLR